MVKYKFLILIFILVCLLTFSNSFALEVIKAGVPAKSLNFLPILMGLEKGIFKNDGIDFKYIIMASDISVKAVLANEIDFSLSHGSTLRAAATGIPVRVVMFTVGDLTFSMYGRPEIKTVKDLKGKIIGATSLASSTAVVAREILRHHGVDPDKDVTIISTGSTNNNLISLQSGAVHGAVLSPPLDAIAEKFGLNYLFYAADIMSLPQAGIGATLTKIKTNPAMIKKLIRTILKTMKYTIENKEESIAYTAKTFKLEPVVAEKSYIKVTRAFTKNGKVSEKALLGEIQMMERLRREKIGVSPDQLVDYSLLDEVLREK